LLKYIIIKIFIHILIIKMQLNIIGIKRLTLSLNSSILEYLQRSLVIGQQRCLTLLIMRSMKKKN